MTGVDLAKLTDHIKRLCVPNLRSKRVKCCAKCPFEQIIIRARPDTEVLFVRKRAQVNGVGKCSSA